MFIYCKHIVFWYQAWCLKHIEPIPFRPFFTLYANSDNCSHKALRCPNECYNGTSHIVFHVFQTNSNNSQEQHQYIILEISRAKSLFEFPLGLVFFLKCNGNLMVLCLDVRNSVLLRSTVRSSSFATNHWASTTKVFMLETVQLSHFVILWLLLMFIRGKLPSSSLSLVMCLRGEKCNLLMVDIFCLV